MGPENGDDPASTGSVTNTQKLSPAKHTKQVEMTPAVARRLTEEIKRSAEKLWSLLLDAYELNVWKVLGYSSWREYAITEFGISESRAYQLLDAGRLTRALERSGCSTFVENLNEAQTRALAPLKDDPDLVMEVMAEVVDITAGRLTAKAITKVITKKTGMGGRLDGYLKSKVLDKNADTILARSVVHVIGPLAGLSQQIDYSDLTDSVLIADAEQQLTAAIAELTKMRRKLFEGRASGHTGGVLEPVRESRRHPSSNPEEWTPAEWELFDAKVATGARDVLTAFNVQRRGIYNPSVRVRALLALLAPPQDIDAEFAVLLEDEQQ